MSLDLTHMLEGKKVIIIINLLQTCKDVFSHVLFQMTYGCIYCRLFREYLLLVFVNQMAFALFRFIAAMGRNLIIANTFGSAALLMLFALSGFVLLRGIT